MFVDRPDIIILTETWLHGGIKNSELGLSNYNIFRKDRLKNLLRNNNDDDDEEDDESVRGGGVLIAVSKTLKSSNIDCKLFQHDSILSDELYIKVTIDKNKFIIGTTYIPPNSPLLIYERHAENIDNISKLYSDHKLIISGDFNLSKISWSYNDFLHCDFQEGSFLPIKQAASLIGDLYNSFNLRQIFPNHPNKSYTLDLMFADSELVEYLHSSDQLVPLDFPHHECASFKLNISNSCMPYKHFSKYNFHNIDTEALSTCLGSLNWEEILDFEVMNINEAVNLFYEILYAAVDFSVPRIGVLPRKFPNWFSYDLKCAIFKKKF